LTRFDTEHPKPILDNGAQAVSIFKILCSRYSAKRSRSDRIANGWRFASRYLGYGHTTVSQRFALDDEWNQARAF
jgi:hypothetical protein